MRQETGPSLFAASTTLTERIWYAHWWEGTQTLTIPSCWHTIFSHYRFSRVLPCALLILEQKGCKISCSALVIFFPSMCTYINNQKRCWVKKKLSTFSLSSNFRAAQCTVCTGAVKIYSGRCIAVPSLKNCVYLRIVSTCMFCYATRQQQQRCKLTFLSTSGVKRYRSSVWKNLWPWSPPWCWLLLYFIKTSGCPGTVRQTIPGDVTSIAKGNT